MAECGQCKREENGEMMSETLREEARRIVAEGKYATVFELAMFAVDLAERALIAEARTRLIVHVLQNPPDNEADENETQVAPPDASVGDLTRFENLAVEGK